MSDHNDNYEKFCKKCPWNDCDYGCMCPAYEEIWQCDMYIYYHPKEFKEFIEHFEKHFEKNS